ncbi:MAG: AMP-binding protein [Chthoniobacterales bacterium]|nr:AMP-binding protein [Chthoniobacterales bacterium]
MKSHRINAPTLTEVYAGAAERFGDLPAFARKDASGKFLPCSFRELYETGLNLATALIHLGVQAGDHVGLLADNRLEWIFCDYGVLLAGAADVPRGTDITEDEMAYILTHADVRVVFVENLTTLERLQRCHHRLRKIEKIVLMSAGGEPPRGVLRLEDLVADGAERRRAGDQSALKRAADVKPEDLFTIIYTSGTTGTPKGVPLTHANMCSQIANLPFELEPGDRTLSILPIWHSYERIFEMVAIAMGACTYYTSLRSIGEDLKVVRPTLMASAPRLWESLYQKILSNVRNSPPLRRLLFHAAYACARTVHRAERFFLGQELDLSGRRLSAKLTLSARRAVGWLLAILPHRILDRLVLSKLRGIVGGRFRGTISGGGALQPHVDEFFNFIGIPVLEGYGLTETSPVLAVRTWSNLVIGTVGHPYPGTEVRLVDLHTGEILYPSTWKRGHGRGLRGEIHVRGPQVMKGYHKDPAGTDRVLRDGWFNTGDIGMITFNNCLKILGRSKDTIVLLSGENVEPVPIEARLVGSALIEQCMVVGQDEKNLGALIVPALDGFRAAGLKVAQLPEILQREDAHRLMDGEIRRLVNAEAGFKPFERIAVWRFIPKSFEVGDELTNTYKLKRHVITERYPEVIAEMFPREPA